MEKILDLITAKMQRAFEAAGYDASYGRVTVSNRPDLCEYQCNGALAAAKQYHCAPIQIAQAVAGQLDRADYDMCEAVMPGFINLKLSGRFLAGYLEQMRTAPDFGAEKIGAGKTIVVDYGGANVAKPLHIGHLRPAIIGETLKRLYRFLGYNAIGDVHLGDWGLDPVTGSHVHGVQGLLLFIRQAWDGKNHFLDLVAVQLPHGRLAFQQNRDAVD